MKKRSGSRREVTLETLDARFDVLDDKLVAFDEKVDGFQEAVISQFERAEDRLLKIEHEMLKMRDDIRAVDAKVSGIWNVIDVHADRIKKLEIGFERMQSRTR